MESKLKRIEDYNKTLPIVELYTAVQSEGSRAGMPTVVIRTTGCTHRCWFGEGGWCDSWYTSIHPEKGIYTFDNLLKDTDYQVELIREKCGTTTLKKTTRNIQGSTEITADFPVFCEGFVIKIDNIYYDLGKYNIRPDAGKELDKLIDILNQYPSMTIELRSHTDSRGSDQSNMTLSQNRAQFAVKYLVSKGINQSRMIAKGYGETELLNSCANGIQCSEEEHQLNRRTEFKILSIK